MAEVNSEHRTAKSKRQTVNSKEPKPTDNSGLSTAESEHREANAIRCFAVLMLCRADALLD
jgi:hypothetical protein